MRRPNGACVLIALSTLFLAVTACDEVLGTNEDGEPEHDPALVGHWVAISGLITDAANAANTFDIITDGGGFMTIGFDADGTVARSEYDPGSGDIEDVAGTWYTDGGSLIIDWASDPGEDVVAYQVTGGHVVVDIGEEDFDFNDDGIDDLGNLVFTFADITNSPDSALVGSWTATAMTYTSVANPGTTMEVTQFGVEFTMTAAADGTYTVVITNPDESGTTVENESGLYTALEGLLWVYATSYADAGIALLTYTVNGDSATFFHGWDEEFDFDDDGFDEPATLTLSLSRQ